MFSQTDHFSSSAQDLQHVCNKPPGKADSATDVPTNEAYM